MKKISTIILDLGGVILNLDQDLTYRNFAKLGFDLDLVNDQSSLFNDFEKGKIHAQHFRDSIKSFVNGDVTDNQIDEAWNSMLLDLPKERLDYLKSLQNNYEVYVLSNTNSIHIESFSNYFEKHFKEENWNSFFNKIYYSHEIGLRKPDADIFEFVLSDILKDPKECIFIDDNKLNLKGAESCGIRTIWAQQPLSEITLAEIKMISDAMHKPAN